MNIACVKRTQRRFETAFDSALNIQAYGKDNLYPQRMSELIDASPTGSTCLERYWTFIEGNGFNDTAFSEYICNRKCETVDDVFHLVAVDLARYNGFAVHVNYNMEGKITELNHVPFESCRLEEETEDGKVTYINIHQDWTGQKTRGGKKIQVNKNNVKKIYTFNPIPDVVLSEVLKSGGNIRSYCGQILWVSMCGVFRYPKPIYDRVVTSLSTDEGLDNVKYRNVRNNFLMAGMLVHKKGAGMIDENGNIVGSDDKDEDFTKALDIFQGDQNACSIMDVTVQADEDKPEFVPIEGNNFDKKFDVTEKSVTERIYSAFGQEPWYCIRSGKVGFSGNILTDAYEYYNSFVSKERALISRAFSRIFANWETEVNTSGDYTIQPLQYISNKKE